MAELFSNNAVSTLTGSLSAVATSLTVQAGHGARFPNPGASDFFRLVLVRKSDGAYEIVFCTARSGDILTITRAQESTSALAFVASDIVELRPTAGFFTSLTVTAATIQNNTYTYDATDTGSANVYIIQPSPAIAAYVEGQEFWWKVGVTNTGPSTLNISALGTSPSIILLDGSALYAGALQATRIAHTIFNGTSHVLQNALVGSSVPGTVEPSKAVVVNGNKDALGFGKITGTTSTGYTVSFTYTGTTNYDRAIAGYANGVTGITYAVSGESQSTTSGAAAVFGLAYGATGSVSGGYFESRSNAGFGLQAVSTVAGGVPVRADAADAIDVNAVADFRKGLSRLLFNPKTSAGSFNSIVQSGDQVITSVGADGLANSAVITITTYASDAVGIRISAVSDTVDISGTLQRNGSTVLSLVLLDTPEQLVSNSTGNGVWYTINSATLATAQAKAAIIRYLVSANETSGTLASVDGFLRKTGSGAALDDLSRVAMGQNVSPSAINLVCVDAVEATVNLNNTNDFDWYTRLNAGDATNTDLILVGYYV